MIYGCLLPKNIESLLQYLLVVEGLENANIRLQLSWLEREWADCQVGFYWLLIDIAVWVSLSFDNLNRRVFILDWALRKAFNTNQESYKLMRKFIFERWFRNGPGEEFAITSIFLLQHSLYSDHRIANEILVYILKNAGESEERICKIFKFANKKGYLK